MPNKNYLAGRRLEWASQDRWIAAGYVTARSAGSHGVWDVCAVRYDRPVELIQCKVVKTEAQAEKLLRDFRAKPPLKPSKFYHQILVVRVKGSKSTALHTAIV